MKKENNTSPRGNMITLTDYKIDNDNNSISHDKNEIKHKVFTAIRRESWENENETLYISVMKQKDNGKIIYSNKTKDDGIIGSWKLSVFYSADDAQLALAHTISKKIEKYYKEQS